MLDPANWHLRNLLQRALYALSVVCSGGHPEATRSVNQKCNSHIDPKIGYAQLGSER